MKINLSRKSPFLLLMLLSSCSPSKAFFYQNGSYSDSDKDVSVSVVLRDTKKGSLITQVEPSYASLKAKRNIPRLVENTDVLWHQEGADRVLEDNQRRKIAKVQRKPDGSFTLVFNGTPTFLLRKEYNFIPLEFNLAPVGRKAKN